MIFLFYFKVSYILRCNIAFLHAGYFNLSLKDNRDISVFICKHLLTLSRCFQVSAYLVKQAEEHGQKVDVKSKEHQEIIENIFAHEDKDKDGAISHDEFSGPKHDEL